MVSLKSFLVAACALLFAGEVAAVSMNDKLSPSAIHSNNAKTFLRGVSSTPSLAKRAWVISEKTLTSCLKITGCAKSVWIIDSRSKRVLNTLGTYHLPNAIEMPTGAGVTNIQCVRDLMKRSRTKTDLSEPRFLVFVDDDKDSESVRIGDDVMLGTPGVLLAYNYLANIDAKGNRSIYKKQSVLVVDGGVPALQRAWRGF